MRAFALAVLLLVIPCFSSAEEPQVVKSGTGDAIEFPGHLTRVLANHHHSPGKTAILELTLPPRTFGAPPHVHTNEDEHFYVLDGAVDFLDREEVVRASAGDLVVLPRGYVHGFWNDTDEPARMLLIISPGEFSDFFDEVVAEIRKKNANNPQAIGGLLVEAAAKRGVEIHFDKVPASAVHLLPK
ncbi:MAG: cupin domain-containing protein [Candidatus Eisenbacteria bacterium]|uniref:Cupin domain-containing protein n=1 Tax=Eiseniibacteriota bacterium TaxID=2212470 RepID=A0A7Y2H3R9_UNCEI|nr:cupin domain-containing protein [Candidatus Eisenbacteria bacterium]